MGRCQLPGRSRGVASRVQGPAFQPLESRALLAAIAWDGGGGNTLWSNVLNWSLDRLPRQSDDVTISVNGSQKTVIADVDVIRVTSLTLSETLVVNSGSALSVISEFNMGEAGQLRINGLVNWNAGTWGSTTPARVNPGGQLNIGSSTFPGIGQVTVSTAIENNGRFGWRGGEIVLEADGSLINRPTKAMDFASPMAITGEGSVVNNGLLRRGGNAFEETTIDVAFTSTDRFYVLRGTAEIGTSEDSPAAELGGRVSVLQPEARLIFDAPATHADGIEYTGPGTVIFKGGEQTFEGDASFGGGFEAEGEGGGSEVRLDFTGANAVIRGDLEAQLAFLGILANTTFDGDVRLNDTIVSDTGLVSSPVVTFAGSVIMETVALAVDGVIAQGSTAESGLPIFGDHGALTISGGYRLTNRGTLTHQNGTLGIGVGASLQNEAGATLILRGATVGGGPLSGPLINAGTLIRRNSETGTGTTSITGTLDSNGVVNVEEGVLNIANRLAQLEEVPPAEDTVLTGGTWQVRNFARLNMPQGLERIGVNAKVELFDQAALPAMIAFKENRGLLRLTGAGPGISGPGTIVNKGTIQLEGTLFALRVFESPVDQKASGRIIVKNGTLQMHGTQGATRNFANPGLIRVEGGTFSLQLDLNGVQGTFLNTGTLDLRKDGSVNVVGAVSTTGTYLTEIAVAAYGDVTATRTVHIDGDVTVKWVGTGFFSNHQATILLSGAFTVTGTFDNFTRVNVPAGMVASMQTQFSVSVRVQ